MATTASPIAQAQTAVKKGDYTVETYLRFGFAGALCCSITHTDVVPMDVVKTRMQTNPGQYKSMIDGFRTISAQEGAGMLLKGAGPTAVGYFMQGAFKFGFNEFFKKKIHQSRWT
jgi:solute carrier family 25 phosphate transporter 3